MASFNKSIIAGNLTRDPELRYTPQGTAVTDITVAVNNPRKKDEPPVFIDCTVWDKAAEVICEYTQKGSNILVEGRITQDSWDDKDTGKKRTKLKIVCESFQFLGGKDDNQQTSRQQQQQGQPVNQHQGQQAPTINTGEYAPPADTPF